MSQFRKSHVVVPGALKHPMQESFETLVRQQDDFRNIFKDVNSHFKGKKTTPNLVDFNKVKEYAIKNGHYEKLRDMVKKFVATDHRAIAAKSAIKPPYSSELYERILPTKNIVDVGCGDGKRVARYAGYFGFVVGTDKKIIPKVDYWPKHWKEEIGLVRSGEINVSFLVMTQLDDKSKSDLRSEDGMHIYPSHDGLIKNGLATIEKGKVVSDMGGQIFVEDKNQDQGDALNSLYVFENTYKERDVVLVATGRGMVPYCGGVYKRAIGVPSGVPTWKYDGTFAKLVVKGNRFQISDRSGRALFGDVLGGVDMELHVEMMEECLVLLRVCNYRAMRPYHGLAGLERFVSKVRIRLRLGGVDKELVCPKEVTDEELLPTDGWVYRVGEMDIVVNNGVHFDIRGRDMVRFRQWLRKNRCIKDWREGGVTDWDKNAIYDVRVDELAKSIFVSERKDKKNHDEDDCWKDKISLMTVGKLKLLHEGYSDGVMVADDDDGFTTDEE